MANNQTLKLTNESKNIVEESNLSKVKNIITEISNNYDSQKPVLDWSKYASELNPKSYTAPTEDEISQNAVDNLADLKTTNINKILADYDNDTNTINTKIQDEQDELEQSISNAKYNEKSSIESAQHKAIKQGIERSSILDNVKNNITTNTENVINEAKTNYNKEIESLQLKQNVIEAEKDLALEKFDISYANKLDDEISKIKTDIANKQKEIEEYNAQIEKRKNEIQEQFDNENANTIEELETSKQRDIAKSVFDILKGISKSEAKEIIKDPDVASSLGDWLSIVSVWLRDY